MNAKSITPTLSVSEQVLPQEVSRQTPGLHPRLVDRRHQTQPSGLVAEGTDAAPDILESHAARARMDGQTAAGHRILNQGQSS